MKLPAEIRLMIYEFAVLDNIVDAHAEVASVYESWPPVPDQTYVGGLALIHTTNTIRKESRHAMYAAAYRQWEVLFPPTCDLETPPTVNFESLWVSDVWMALKEVRSSKALLS